MKIQFHLVLFLLCLHYGFSQGNEKKILLQDCTDKNIKSIYPYHDSLCVVFSDEIRIVSAINGACRQIAKEKYSLDEAKILNDTICYLVISPAISEDSQSVSLCRVGDIANRIKLTLKDYKYYCGCALQSLHSFSIYYNAIMVDVDLNPDVRIRTTPYSERDFRSNIYTDIKNGTMSCLIEKYIKNQKNNGLSYLIVKGNQMQEIPIDSIVKANMYFLVYTISKVYKNIVYLQDSYPGLKEDKWIYRFTVGNKKTTFKKSKKPVNDTFLTGVDDNNFYFTRQFDNENIIEITIIKKSDLF